MDAPLRLADWSIPEAIIRRSAHLGDRAALLAQSGGEWHPVTFAQLVLRIENAASALRSRGLAQGDRVALLGANSPEWGTAYLAIQRAGGVAVPLDRLQTPHEWLEHLRRSGAVMLFVSPGEGPRILPEMSKQFSSIKAFSLHGHLEHTNESLEFLWSSPGPSLPPVSPDEVAAIIFTSGTTGKSKGVMLTHANILANAEAMLDRIDIDESDRFLSVLPMSYCYECTCGFIAPLLAGAPVYFARGFAPREIVGDLQSSSATFLLGVPLLYEKINLGLSRGLKDLGLRGLLVKNLWALSRLGHSVWRHRFGRLALGSVRTKTGLTRMRYMVSGGAAMPEHVSKSLEALGVRVLQGYGLTETSPVVTLNPKERSNPASVGLPLSGVEVRIHEPTDAGDGEVRVRGKIVMRGYWQDEAATGQAIQDGWFCSGDLGRFDARGHLHITGRLKNLIISPGGKNISPEEIEAAVLLSPAVAEILVYGRRIASGSGEEVCARVFPHFEFVEARGWPKSDLPALLPHIRKELDSATASLAAYKRIVHLELVMEPFAKTTSQKIKRHSQPESR